jgi:hypothetical protein
MLGGGARVKKANKLLGRRAGHKGICCRRSTFLLQIKKKLGFNSSVSLTKQFCFLFFFLSSAPKLLFTLSGGYSSIGRTTVCGTVRSLFDSGYPPCRSCHIDSQELALKG